MGLILPARRGLMAVGRGRQVSLATVLKSASVVWGTWPIVPGFGGTPATSTTFNDQIGSNNAVAVAGGPALSADLIGDVNYYDFDGVDDRQAFGSIAFGAGDFDVTAAIGVKAGLNTLSAIIGRTATTTGLRGTGVAEITSRTDSNSDLHNLVYAMVQGPQLVRWSREALVMKVAANAEQVAVSRTRGDNVTLDQLGRSFTNVWGSLLIGACIIHRRKLSDAEYQLLYAYLSSVWRKGLYIKAAGSDSAYGINDGRALATLGKIRPMIHRKGQIINIKGGDTFTKDPLLLNVTNQGGVAGEPVKVQAYGSGQFTLDGGTDLGTGGWAGGPEYTKVQALTNNQAVAVTIGGVETILAPGTAGALAAGQWAYTAGTTTVSIRLPGDANPNTYTAIVALDAAAGVADVDGVRLAKNYIEVKGINAKHWPSNGVRFEGNFCKGSDLTAECNASDGIGGSGVGIELENISSRGNGDGTHQIAAPGDGLSFHSASTVLARIGNIEKNYKAGVDHQETVVADHYRFRIRGNYRNIYCASAAGTPGRQSFNSSIIILDALDLDVLAETGQSPAWFFYHCVFINLKGAKGSTRAIKHSGSGLVTIRNCIFSGFAQALELTGSGSIDEDYNCFWDNTVSHGSGIPVGPHSIFANPLLNPGAEDFRPQIGSPVIGAGIAVGLTEDYAGNAMPANINIGAYQVAA